MTGSWWWDPVGCPGDVTWARASPDGAVTVACTYGGDLYLGRPGAGPWAWERAGFPPGPADAVRDAAVLGVDAAGAVTLAAVGRDGQVWLYQSQALPQPWTSLGTPPAGPAPVFPADSILTAGLASGDGNPEHTLVVTDAARQPWVRAGTDPGGTWSPLTLDDDLTVLKLATAMASVAPGAAPQLHVIAAVRDQHNGPDGLRIAVAENAAWTWHDPGHLEPANWSIFGLTAASVRDGSGRLLAAAATWASEFDTEAPVLFLLTGAGRDWSWASLGSPPSEIDNPPVIAVSGTGPRAGAGPVVVAGAGNHAWTWSPDTSWADRGAHPAPTGDEDFFLPFTALDQGGVVTSHGVITVSKARDLGTFTLDASGTSWEHHRCPAALTALVGAYDEESGIALNTLVFAIDEHGALWRTGGLRDGRQESPWVYQGLPAAGVKCAAPIGLFRPGGPSSPGPAWVFTAGSDGHLWARGAGAGAPAWADHGPPGGRAVVSGTDPVALTTPAGGLAVHVLADDGRLWMRAGTGPAPGAGWTWTDRGVPAGQLIFSIIGAAACPPSTVVAVTTDDKHVWASVPAGAGFTWFDLGVPEPAGSGGPGRQEGIVAGLGLQVPAGAAGLVEIAGLGAPSGQVWTARWAQGAAAPRWTPRGRPAGLPIQAGCGTTPDPAGGTLIMVLGNDQHVWVLSTGSSTPAWTPWPVLGGPGDPATSLTSGRAVVLGSTGAASAIVLNRLKRAVLIHAS